MDEDNTNSRGTSVLLYIAFLIPALITPVVIHYGHKNQAYSGEPMFRDLNECHPQTRRSLESSPEYDLRKR